MRHYDPSSYYRAGDYDGGLPETDCGGVILVEPDNPEALAQGIYKTISKGSLSSKFRLNLANFLPLNSQ